MSPKFTIEEIMQPNPASTKCGEPLMDAVETLTKHKLIGMPVVDDENRVVGFISEQDCIHSLLATSYFHEGNPVVDEVMSREPLTIGLNDSVLDLARRLGRDKPKVYPVVDNGKLVGLITRSDILKALLVEARANHRHH
jgi:CBS domain-containing protein